MKPNLIELAKSAGMQPHTFALGYYECCLEDLERFAALLTGWEDIATAPKDGSYILVYTRNGQKVVRWYDGNQSYGTNEFRVGTVMDATHWMPLPKPPVFGGGE